MAVPTWGQILQEAMNTNPEVTEQPEPMTATEIAIREADERRERMMRERMEIHQGMIHPTFRTLTAQDFEILDEAFTTTYTHQQPQNTMARQSNRDWLLNENADVLKDIGNPEINHIEVTPVRNDQPSDYNDYGFNILRLNDVRRPVGIPSPEGEVVREIRCARDMYQLKIKIPSTRTNYVFGGIIYQPQAPGYIDPSILHDNEIRLESIEKVSNRENIEPHRLPIATIIRNIIWIHWDITERNSTNKALTRYILKKAGEMIDPNRYPRQRPANYEEHQFLKAIREFEDRKLDQLKRDIVNREQQSEHGFRDYQEAERELTKLKLLLSASQATNSQIQKTAKETIEYFKDHKNVKSWEYRAGNMIFVLQNLEITHTKETFKVPNPRITINLVNGNFTAKSDDQEYQIQQVHPHIFTDGRACTGNFTTIFPKIVKDGKFIQILELLIQFFQSYNQESPAIPWYQWRWLIKNHKTRFENDDQYQEAAREYADYLEKIGEEVDARTQDQLDNEED